MPPPVRLLCEPSSDGAAMIRLPAADRGHDLQWLVDTGGDLDADVVAMAVGRHINGMVSGAPVLALHPDTEAYCDMVAVRISPDRSTSMRSLVAMGGCLHIQGRDCRLLPFTITRSGLARDPPRERQTDRVAAAAMDVRTGGWGGIARHGPVVIRTPTNDVSHQVPEGRATEAMRRDSRAGLLGFPVDGPFLFTPLGTGRHLNGLVARRRCRQSRTERLGS